MKKPRVYVENVCASTEVNETINLRQLSILYPAFDYRPENFAGVIGRFRKPRITVRIFASGKIILVGAHSEKEARKGLVKVIRSLVKYGAITSGKQWLKTKFMKITNVVASCTFGTPVGCGIVNRAFKNYEISKFGGRSYLITDYSATVRIFSSGKIIGVNFKNTDEANECFQEVVRKLQETIDKYDKDRREVCKLERWRPTIEALYKISSRVDWVKWTKKYSTEVLQTAEMLITDYCKKRVRTSYKHTPISVASGALYVAIILTGERLVQEIVANWAHVSGVTVRNASRHILQTVRADVEI